MACLKYRFSGSTERVALNVGGNVRTRSRYATPATTGMRVRMLATV